jgi:hypothetical protein
MDEIVLHLLGLVSRIRIYHWQTDSYAHHKITDDLVTTLDTQIDVFVEAIQGRYGIRIGIKKLNFGNLNISSLKAITQIIRASIDWLYDLEFEFTELEALRDDIIETLDKGLYLLSFN